MIRKIYYEGYRLARIGVQSHVAQSIHPKYSEAIANAYLSLRRRGDYLRVSSQFQYGIFCGRYVPVATDIQLRSGFHPAWEMGFLNSHDLSDYKAREAE